ncbi:MAG: transposase, partial [Candidatus Rokubacteria bacterium]|nr:transposase [Candidatus Rokubacteria bacterium]
MLSRRAMRPVSCARATYQRRQPEQTLLYRTIAAQLPAFLARPAAEDGTGGWPAFVQREFEAYLKCGILRHGLLRVRCERCGDTTVVAFSCNGRGFCPSCGGRRMSELAAHLVDRVIPHVPVRQWVFTVPVPVRYQLAFDAGLTRAVLRVFLGTVFGWLRHIAARRGIPGGRCGAVTAIQRFGGALNATVHFHSLIFDGVYTRPLPTARPVFHRLPPPSDADIAALLTRLDRRVRRLLVRRGRLAEDDAGSDPFAAQAPLFACALAASLQRRVALGPRAGQPVRRLRSAADATATGPRCARLEGFSLHADVAVPARRRDRLEHLVRSLVRPPLALARLTESTGGQLRYQFRRAWSDGSTALLLDPLEWLERLAALVPPPRRPLLASPGVLAPRARWRAAIVPPPAPDGARADAGARAPGTADL